MALPPSRRLAMEIALHKRTDFRRMGVGAKVELTFDPGNLGHR
jgi:hypothetical protein